MRLKSEDGPRDSAKSARLEEAATTKTAPLPFQHSKVGARKKLASKLCRILVRERGKKACAKLIWRIRLSFYLDFTTVLQSRECLALSEEREVSKIIIILLCVSADAGG